MRKSSGISSEKYSSDIFSMEKVYHLLSPRTFPLQSNIEIIKSKFKSLLE